MPNSGADHIARTCTLSLEREEYSLSRMSVQVVHRVRQPQPPDRDLSFDSARARTFCTRHASWLQVNPEKYGNIVNGFRVTLQEAGFRELGRGWAPTFFGYSFQGLGKFGFYEVFKIMYANMMGDVSVALFEWRLLSGWH